MITSEADLPGRLSGREWSSTQGFWRAPAVFEAARALTTPLLPDDYFALINPRWSTRELTGRVIRVRHETDDATTIVIKPDFDWPVHKSGQYLRIGMEINGIRHWRAYTITSDPNHPEGVVSVTVKYTKGGKMSPVFTRYVQPGHKVFLGDVEGEFMLPDPMPAKTLLASRPAAASRRS